MSSCSFKISINDFVFNDLDTHDRPWRGVSHNRCRIGVNQVSIRLREENEGLGNLNSRIRMLDQ